ncbi:MAG: PEP-CTERM sorting domain-containing protein [Pseudomonadota bacterium]
MKLHKTLLGLVATLGLGMGAAHANSFALGGLPTGQIENPGTFSTDFYSSAADASATISFDLAGYASLDGLNAYQDLFTLSINNVVLGSGSFNLGGGGSDFFTWTPGHSGTYVNSPYVAWGGGTVSFSGVVFGLNAGVNTVAFQYIPVQAGPQGTGDESWGINQATVSSNVATISAVPEPETYAMMLAGLALMGTIARRRKSKAA